MPDNTAYLAIPSVSTDSVAPFLYGGSDVVESSEFGTIVRGPATGGFSMDITRDRLASGLYFGKVFPTLTEAQAHNSEFGPLVKKFV